MPRSGRRWYVGVAAAVLAAASIVYLLSQTQRSQPPVMLSEELELVEPRGSVRAIERFLWRTRAQAPLGSFRLRVEGPARESLWESVTDQTDYVPTEAERAKMYGARRIRWSVESLDRAGRRIAWGSWQEVLLTGP